MVPAARELVVDVSALPGYQNSSAYISHAEGENEGFLLLDGAFLFFFLLNPGRKPGKRREKERSILLRVLTIYLNAPKEADNAQLVICFLFV